MTFWLRETLLSPLIPSRLITIRIYSLNASEWSNIHVIWWGIGEMHGGARVEGGWGHIGQYLRNSCSYQEVEPSGRWKALLISFLPDIQFHPILLRLVSRRSMLSCGPDFSSYTSLSRAGRLFYAPQVLSSHYDLNILVRNASEWSNIHVIWWGIGRKILRSAKSRGGWGHTVDNYPCRNGCSFSGRNLSGDGQQDLWAFYWYLVPSNSACSLGDVHTVFVICSHSTAPLLLLCSRETFVLSRMRVWGWYKNLSISSLLVPGFARSWFSWPS